MPVSLLHRRDSPLDGTAPLLLYGYGSYGIAMPASFRTNVLSLVDRGFVYAIAHIRGGTEKGWHWYMDGKREKKPNTFSDFVAGGRRADRAQIYRAGRIVAHGGTAGGLLMGAVANSRRSCSRHRRRSAVRRCAQHHARRQAAADAARMAGMGKPDHRREAFARSCLFALRERGAQAYPAILALGGLTDPRVTYWEPAKWVARLRAPMTGGGPVAAAHQHGSRPRRRRGALRPAGGGRARLRVRDLSQLVSVKSSASSRTPRRR